MTDDTTEGFADEDRAPGEDVHDGKAIAKGIRGYLVGLGVASLLTIASFTAGATGLIYGPALPVALVALAIAQMGVHLVFFLHVTTGPDNTNNVLALAFGVLIVVLVLVGSIWIMAHVSHNLMSMDDMLRAQR